MIGLLIAVAAAPVSLIPAPVMARFGLGQFNLRSGTVLVARGAAKAVAERFRDDLAPATGFKLKLDESGGREKITFTLGDEKALGTEGYRLKIGERQIDIVANQPAGLFYACQTLRQLLPASVYAKTKKSAVWLIPTGEVTDYPRFSWRGMHLDVSRHFYGAKFIKEFIDWLAIHKMNTFHWHLTDDGGWRQESAAFPKLTSIGAWREKQDAEWSYTGLKFPGKDGGKGTYGGFYTQDEIREVVRYASERFINVVPEIEMPGHSTAAIAAYPELACDDAAAVAEYKKTVGSDAVPMVCPGKDNTLRFFETILDETLALFPSKFIHIGADEVDKSIWKVCPTCQKRMADEKLGSVEELQSWFVRHFDKYLTSKGRRLVGWDEILEGGLAPGATVMSWRGIEGGIAAAKAGQEVVMSPTSHCYFDFSYATTPTKQVYGYDPVPAELDETQAARILGAQGNIWTEWLSTEEEIEMMAWPRGAALAEAVWSPKGTRDFDAFSQRLEKHYARFEELGIAYYLEAPRALTELLVLGTGAKVGFASANVPGARLRYTTDGTEPTESSPAFGESYVPIGPGVVKAALFKGSNRSQVTTISVIKIEAKPIADLVPGWTRKTLKGSFTSCPEPAAFAEVAGTESSQVGVGDLAGTEGFAVYYEGFLRVATAGDYVLWLGSDDGSKLWIGDGVAINHDGPHGYSEKAVTLRLPAGDLPIRLVMFEQGGAERLTLHIQGPGAPEKGPIPAAMMFRKT